MLDVVVFKFTGKRHPYHHILGMYSYKIQGDITDKFMCNEFVCWCVIIGNSL